VLVFDARDLVDDDVGENVLGHVLVVKDTHQRDGQLLLHLDADVRLQHLAKVFVFVLQEVEQVFVVPQRQDVHALILTS